jgi:hypothetical protein
MKIVAKAEIKGVCVCVCVCVCIRQGCNFVNVIDLFLKNILLFENILK